MIASPFSLLKRPMSCLAIILLAIAWLGACRKKESVANTKFGWDEGLATIEVPKRSSPGPSNNFDRNFCRGAAPGSCLSLVLRIPREDLVQDLGLSTLAVGAESNNFRAKMEEACSAAWTDYRRKFGGDALHPLRTQVVSRIEKMRCIFYFMKEEVAREDIKLANNEIGVSVRLTKFDINAESKGADVRGVGLSFTNTVALIDYRSAYFYSGKDLSAGKSGWDSAIGIDIKPTRVKASLDYNIEWKLDLAKLNENLSKIDPNGAPIDSNLSSFVNQAKTMVGSLTGSNTPIQSSLLLINMGYNAFKGLCGEDTSKCNVYTSKVSNTQSLKDDLADLVPTSETNELLRLALIKSIQGVLDSVFTKANPEQILGKFQPKK